MNNVIDKKKLRKDMFWSSFPLASGKSSCSAFCVSSRVIDGRCFVRTCFGRAFPWPLEKVCVVLLEFRPRAFPLPREKGCVALFEFRLV